MRLNALPILMDYLKHSTDGGVLRFVLNIINTFLDHGEEVMYNNEVNIQYAKFDILSDLIPKL